MRQVTERQMPAGGPAFDDGFALAGEAEIVEDFKMNNTKPIFFGQAAAKLAVIDALLHVAERTPPGFRSLTRSEVAGESWSMSWGDFIAGVARMFAGAALLSNEGAFALGKRLTVCFRDALQRGLEQGWERIRLASLDGVCRHHDATAPAILVALGGRAFIWCPANFKEQKRVTLSELAELCAEQAFGATRRAA